jgi:Triose-phosphate Transporter family
MNAANLYAVLTLIAFALLLPAALAVEGGRFSAAWAAAIAKGYTRKVLCSTMLLSGLFYYLVSAIHTCTCTLVCTVYELLQSIMSILCKLEAKQ